MQRWWLGLIVMSLSTMAQAAVGLGTITNYSPAGGQTTCTFSATTDAGANRAMILVFHSENATANVSAATVDGNAATFLQRALRNGDHRVEVWYILGQAVGSNSVIITLGDNADVICKAISLSGVHQSSPFGTTATTNVTATSVSQNVTGVTDGLVIDFLTTGLDQDHVHGANQTPIYETSPAGAGFRGSSSTETTVGTATMSESWTTTDFAAHVAVPILPATGRRRIIMSQ